MQYYRCKCGKREAWSSMGVRDCQGCSECGTTLAQHPDYHKDTAPHEWVKRYNQNTGKPYMVCENCMKIEEDSYIESQKTENDGKEKENECIRTEESGEFSDKEQAHQQER